MMVYGTRGLWLTLMWHVESGEWNLMLVMRQQQLLFRTKMLDSAKIKFKCTCILLPCIS